MKSRIEKDLERLKKSLMKEVNEDMKKMFKEATNEDFLIRISQEKGVPEMEVQGKRLSLLIALAGAKKTMLEQLHCSDDEFEMIESMVGVEIKKK